MTLHRSGPGTLHRSGLGTLPTAAEFGRELLALNNDNYVTLKLTPLQAWATMAQIQLALRHPANQGPTTIIAKAVAQYLQGKVATTPALAAVAEAGWSSDHDEEVKP